MTKAGIKEILDYVNIELKAIYEVEEISESDLKQFIKESKNETVEDIKDELFEIAHYE